jgi:hypothetical protein
MAKVNRAQLLEQLHYAERHIAAGAEALDKRRALDKAATGADTADVSLALRLVRMLERVPYRWK